MLGIPSALDTEILGVVDQVAGNFLLIVGGLGIAVFAGWRMQDPVGEVSAGASGVRWFGLWRFVSRIFGRVRRRLDLIRSGRLLGRCRWWPLRRNRSLLGCYPSCSPLRLLTTRLLCLTRHSRQQDQRPEMNG